MLTGPTPVKAFSVGPAVAECHDVEAIEGFLACVVVQVAEVLAVETIAFGFVHLDPPACRGGQEYRAIETEPHTSSRYFLHRKGHFPGAEIFDAMAQSAALN